MDIKEQARKRAEYHSERQKNREAVRDVIKRFQGDNVHKIDAFSASKEEGGRTRTCGYCRVSTLDEEQGMSIQLQIDEYPKKIKANPDLEFTGLYVDDGSSGTNVAGREGFKLMMQEAYAGRFEQIFTKSVSRFARNIILSNLAVTLIAVLGAWLMAQIGKAQELKTINTAIGQLTSAAETTVLELNQTTVDGLKAASADGKLTKEEITMLGKKLLEGTLAKMSESAIGVLKAANVDVNNLVKGAGEALIARIKNVPDVPSLPEASSNPDTSV